MRRQQKYQDTAVFTYYNANPKGRITGDCVIRALSTALSADYKGVLKDLYETQLKTAYMLNSKECYKAYLKALGYEMQKQPRKSNGTKYTGAEFVKSFASDEYNYIVHIGGHHVAAVKNNKLCDIWDCSNKSIGNYWKIPKKQKGALDQ